MLLKNKVEIETWLKLNYVKKYELIEDDQYGYVVNIDGDLDLYGRCLKSIDVKFNIVNGDFDCGVNYLKNLEGCPNIVKNNVILYHNHLENLKGISDEIGGSLNLSFNRLNDLSYLPKNLKSKKIILKNNKLIENYSHIENIDDLINFYKITNEKKLLTNFINNNISFIKDKIMKI